MGDDGVWTEVCRCSFQLPWRESRTRLLLSYNMYLYLCTQTRAVIMRCSLFEIYRTLCFISRRSSAACSFNKSFYRCLVHTYKARWKQSGSYCFFFLKRWKITNNCWYSRSPANRATRKPCRFKWRFFVFSIILVIVIYVRGVKIITFLAFAIVVIA